MRKPKAKDARRGALKSPWWTLGCRYQPMGNSDLIGGGGPTLLWQRIEAVRDGNLRSCSSGRDGRGETRENMRGSRVESPHRIRVGSWNVGSLTGKLLELVDVLERHQVDISCFQESKWKGSSIREGNGYKICERIISLSLVIDGETVNVVSAYAPQVGLSDEVKKTFWDSLDEVVRELPTNQRLFLGGDLNGHIGAASDGNPGVHEGFGFGVRNDGGRCTQIDYLLVRRGDLKACKDCSVFPGEACSSQHRLLALDTMFKSVHRMRLGRVTPRILWKNLTGDATETFRSRVAEGVATQAEDILGVAMGTSKTHTARRESWWLDEEVQSKVAAKQSRFKELLSCQEGNQEERLRVQEKYKEAKKEAKKAVAQPKEKAYEELYKKMDSKEGANDIFNIAKARERRRRELENICFIKDERGRTITDEKEIKKRWGEYFSSLFNTREPVGNEEGEDPNILPHFDCYYSRIQQTEVRTALQKIGRNKAVGPDQIPIKAWRSLGKEGISLLTSLFNKIFFGAKIPEEWRLSDVIPIFKNKGDAQVCSNYRGIKFIGHTMKFWERVIERRLRRETTASENQFGFMPGRSSVEAIHLIRSLMEKYRERQRDLHFAFLDIEKAYDSTRVRTPIGNTEFFPVEVGLHQGSAISPCLFAMILNDLSRGIQEDIPWSMIFVDDIVLVSESTEGWRLRFWGCLRWTCGRTMLDMIPNGVYRAELEVENIINKMRERKCFVASVLFASLHARFLPCCAFRALCILLLFLGGFCALVVSDRFACENARLGNGSTSWSVQAVQEMLSAVGVRMDVHIKSVTPLYDIVLARMIERITSNTSY
ncbi:retrovirus-related pol polyprotein LINE-1 [Tanacetum coccineum]